MFFCFVFLRVVSIRGTEWLLSAFVCHCCILLDVLEFKRMFVSKHWLKLISVKSIYSYVCNNKTIWEQIHRQKVQNKTKKIRQTKGKKMGENKEREMYAK